MASFKAFDAIRDTTTTTGTGAIALSGVPPIGFVTFGTRYSVNDTVEYTIRHRTADEWETGYGTYSASNQITRTTVYESSNSNAAVSFSAGTKDVFSGPIASAAGQHRAMLETVSTVDTTITVGGVGSMQTANKATAITFTLPAVAAMLVSTSNYGFFQFRNIGVGDLTIDANASETIDGNLTLVLKTGESALLWVNSGGTAWRAQVILATRTSVNVLADLGAFGKFPFPATQVASAGANDLDDYEEGTFTPTITLGGAGVGITYNSQTGVYTKIGRLVTFGLRAWLSSKGSSTGDVFINGLPFTASATDFPVSGFSTNVTSGIGGSMLFYEVLASQAGVRISKISGGGASILQETDLQATSLIDVAGSYFV